MTFPSEFNEKAAPLLYQPGIADLELPDMIDLPTGVATVKETPEGLVVGPLISEVTDTLDMPASGDIRLLNNVEYRKHLSKLVRGHLTSFRS